MGFQIITKLSSREKTKKDEDARAWLQERGELPDPNALLEARRLLNELQQELAMQGHTNTAMSKLAANAQEQLNKIKL